MKNRKIMPQLVVSAALIVVTLCATVFANNVHAGETGSLINKWRWAQYYDCLFSSGWLIDINVNSYSSKKVLKTLYDDMSGDVNLPSYKYGHESNSTSISCYKSIVGTDGWTGSLESYNSIKFSQSSEMESLMRSLGYLPDSETGREKQFTIHASTQTARTDAVTAQTQWTSGEEDTVLITTSPNDDGTTTYSYSSSQFFHDIKVDFEDSNLVIYVEGSWLGDCSTPGEQRVSIPLQHDPVATRDLIEEALGNMTWYKTCHHDSAQLFYTIQTRYDFVVGEVVNMGDAGVYRYQYKDDYYSGANFVSQTYGGGVLSELTPNNTEIYNLYLHYLQKAIPQDVQNRLTTTPTSTTNLTKIRLKASDGTFKDFYANFNGTSPSSITVYTLKTYQFNDDHSKKFPKIVAITMQDVIDWFNSVNTSTLGEVDLTDDDSGTISTTTTTGEGEDDESEGDPEEVACYQNAGSLGWIMCPMIFGLRGIGEKFYAVAEPFLQTNESIVAELGSQDSGLYQAWLVFRNIANVIFVIIFMFIIFSQLTGWGIDNYGIKKMLPKLILVAILVNLSYIICAIAVDASNIVGQGVRGLFENVAKSVSDTGGLGDSATEAVGVIVKKVVAIIATGGVGLAGVAIAAEISGSGWFLIVPVLLFLLTLLASAFFAIIMLGLRQALIVILIVIAPIAFALSVLPNTEAIYKKWFSVAKGVLMVYPIVGAVIGAGYLTARILMNTDQGFIMTIVAGLLMSVPYFMIPSITRKALDAVGGIGTKLTGIGKTGVSKANHGIKGSDLYNDAKAGDKARRAQSWMNSKRAQKIQDDINSGKKVSMRRANKYSRMAGLANSREQANINARSAQSQFNRLQGDGYTAAMSAAQRSEEDMAVKNFETLIENGDYKYGGNTKGVNFQDNEAIGKALEHELANGGDVNKIRALQNILNRKGDKGRDAIFKAMSNAQKTGNVSADAVKAFSSNIMNNQSDYKSSHRSLYEFAKSTAVSGSGSIDDFKTSGIAALTQSSFLGTDATQMGEYLKAYRNGSLSDEDKTHLEELAHGIANNPNVHGSIRKDDYGEALETFAPDVDWSKVYNGVSGLKVDHSSSQQTQSTPAPSAPSAATQAAQAGAQQIAATQNAQTIVNNTHQNAANNSNNNGIEGFHQTDSGIWIPDGH